MFAKLSKPAFLRDMRPLLPRASYAVSLLCGIGFIAAVTMSFANPEPPVTTSVSAATTA